MVSITEGGKEYNLWVGSAKREPDSEAEMDHSFSSVVVWLLMINVKRGGERDRWGRSEGISGDGEAGGAVWVEKMRLNEGLQQLLRIIFAAARGRSDQISQNTSKINDIPQSSQLFAEDPSRSHAFA
jgi:hypothetical protein